MAELSLFLRFCRKIKLLLTNNCTCRDSGTYKWRDIPSHVQEDTPSQEQKNKRLNIISILKINSTLHTDPYNKTSTVVVGEGYQRRDLPTTESLHPLLLHYILKWLCACFYSGCQGYVTCICMEHSVTFFSWLYLQSFNTGSMRNCASLAHISNFYCNVWVFKGSTARARDHFLE